MSTQQNPAFAPESTGEELASLVNERLRLVIQLIELTEQQSDAISAGHLSQLMTLLAAKQAPINQLSKLSKTLAAETQSPKSSRRWSSETDRQKCRDAHDRCEKLLLELIAREKACEDRLKANQDVVGQDLDRTHDTGRAMQSYERVAAGFDANAAAPSAGDRLDLSSQ